MSDEYYTVRSVYTPNSDLTELVLSINGPEDNEWLYSFFDDDIPAYLRTHAERNSEAEETSINTKLSRMVEDHMNENSEQDWNF